MGPMWKGMLSFGLVNVPVSLHSATRKKTISFNQLRKSDGSRINHKKVAAIDGNEVQKEDIVKGYEISKGKYVVITDDDIASIAPKSSRVVEITDFVRAEQIDPRHYDSSYYLVPSEGAGKAYTLLLKSMQDENVVGIARFVLRSKEYLAAIRPAEGAFVLSTMLFADEVIPVQEFASYMNPVDLSDKEMSMAKMLIQSQISDFRPEAYENQYNKQVLDLIDRKAIEQMITAPAQQAGSNVVDLMAALKASIELAKAEKAKMNKPKVKTKKAKPA
jgi:DNA end-binding protein Ku